MVTTTTRSRPRRRKVTQDDADSSAQTGPGLSLPPPLQPKASWKCLLLTLWAQGYGLSAGIAVVGRCLQVLAEPSAVSVTGEAQAGAEGSDGCVGWG